MAAMHDGRVAADTAFAAIDDQAYYLADRLYATVQLSKAEMAKEYEEKSCQYEQIIAKLKAEAEAAQRHATEVDSRRLLGDCNLCCIHVCAGRH